MKKTKPEFDVALSFAGEDRTYVEEVAHILRQMGLRVFYDKYETVSLWGKDLYAHLREIYFNRARYTVVFISKHYKKKLWTNLEREGAQARAFQEHKEYILPARFDNTQIPGILPTTGYVNLKELSPAELAQLIKRKVGPIERSEYFPSYPDKLFTYLGVPTKAKKDREEIYSLAYGLFESMKLMTPVERQALAEAVMNTCAAGPPENVHLRLDYLSRLTSLPSKELISLFSRLDCLYIKARAYKDRDHADRNKSAKRYDVIEIKYEPLIGDFIGNATIIMIAVFHCIYNSFCPEHAKRAIELVDLSALSTLATFEEKHGAQKLPQQEKPNNGMQRTRKSARSSSSKGRARR